MAITSDNKKLQLFFVSKAENEEDAEIQLREMQNENKFTFSSSSYMNSECFVKYLHFLRDLYPNNQKNHLILDCYSSWKR